MEIVREMGWNGMFWMCWNLTIFPASVPDDFHVQCRWVFAPGAMVRVGLEPRPRELQAYKAWRWSEIGFCCMLDIQAMSLAKNKRCTKDHQRSPKYFCIFLRCSGQVRIVSNLFGLPLDPAESAGSTRQRPATQCQWSTSSRPGTARFDAICDMPRCLDSPVVTYLVWQMNVKVDDNMMIITWW